MRRLFATAAVATLLLALGSSAAVVVPNAAPPPPPLNKSEHDNDVYFPLMDGGNVTSYLVSLLNTGDGQGCGHVIAPGQPYAGTYQINDGFNVRCGRHGTREVANDFGGDLRKNNAVVSYTDGFATLPSELNLCIGNTNPGTGCALVIAINGTQHACPGVRIGQGHDYRHNNWWMGGPLCIGAGGKAPLFCNCTGGSTPGLTFVPGAGDNIFNVHSQCSAGHNCDLAQCKQDGFQTVCDATRECFYTLGACTFGCPGNCPL